MAHATPPLVSVLVYAMSWVDSVTPASLVSMALEHLLDACRAAVILLVLPVSSVTSWVCVSVFLVSQGGHVINASRDSLDCQPVDVKVHIILFEQSYRTY